jgi:leader peptidase (prepilin peptidase)/N-methyltransferase
MLTVLEFIDTALPVVLAGALGMVLASFLCVVAERVPRGESLMGRSHCVCGRQLDGSENIPVFGWLLSRGRARCCGAKIPARYVLSEAGLGLWCALAALLLPTWVALAACVAGGLVMTLVVWRMAVADGAGSASKPVAP